MFNPFKTQSVVGVFSMLAALAFALGDDANPGGTKAAGEVRLRDMRHCAGEFKFHAGKSSSESILVETPILRFSDPARLHSDGTVWVWGRDGRPKFAMEIYTNAYDKAGWVCVGHSLTTQSVRAELSGNPDWLSSGPGIKFQRLDDVEPPSERAEQRPRQLRALARRLTGHQFWKPGNTRYELRLLTTPLHRYTDRQQHVTEGALFTLVHGTNPEIIVLLEAVETPDERRAWQCAFARLGHAAMHVQFDGKEIWSGGRIDKGIKDGGYLVFFYERQSSK